MAEQKVNPAVMSDTNTNQETPADSRDTAGDGGESRVKDVWLAPESLPRFENALWSHVQHYHAVILPSLTGRDSKGPDSFEQWIGIEPRQKARSRKGYRGGATASRKCESALFLNLGSLRKPPVRAIVVSLLSGFFQGFLPKGRICEEYLASLDKLYAKLIRRFRRIFSASDIHLLLYESVFCSNPGLAALFAGLRSLGGKSRLPVPHSQQAHPLSCGDLPYNLIADLIDCALTRQSKIPELSKHDSSTRLPSRE